MKLDFKAILWYNKDTSDKVWTAFEADGRMYAGWGRRGKSLRFKDHGKKSIYTHSAVNKLIDKKKDEGYAVTDEFQLFLLFPDFSDVVEKKLFQDLVDGKVM